MDYHVALSFAGEDREYVEQVADHLRRAGVTVFYDRYEQVSLWGKNLYEHLSDVYQNRAHFTVMFVSHHYAEKLWTKHEWKSAQARAFRESREYVLPVRFDDTEVPGLPETTGYLDLRRLNPSQLGDAICEKVARSDLTLRYGTIPPRGAEEAPLQAALKTTEDALGNGGLYGLSTGFKSIDDITGGLRPGELTVLASRPSMGRSLLSLSIARRAAGVLAGHPVLYVSTEQTKEEVALRLLALEARFSRQDASGGITDETAMKYSRLAKAALAPGVRAVHVYTALGATVDAVVSEVTGFQRRLGLDLLVVDKLNDLVASGPHVKPEDQAGSVAKALKRAAVDLGVPVLATASLSRSVDARGGDRRPLLSDLAGGDTLVDVADRVLSLYRAEQYGITVDEMGNSTEGLAEVAAHKQRSGPLGVAKIAFISQFGRFEPLTAWLG